MEIILTISVIIGFFAVFIGLIFSIIETISIYTLSFFVSKLGLQIYCAEKIIQNEIEKSNIGKKVRLIDAQVIFSTKYQCSFASRLTFNSLFSPIHQVPIKGEIVWSGENAKIIARMPLSQIIILIGAVMVFGTLPLFSIFGLLESSKFDITTIFPLIIICGLSYMAYFLSKKNAVRIVNCIIELVKPKNK